MLLCAATYLLFFTVELPTLLCYLRTTVVLLLEPRLSPQLGEILLKCWSVDEIFCLFFGLDERRRFTGGFGESWSLFFEILVLLVLVVAVP